MRFWWVDGWIDVETAGRTDGEAALMLCLLSLPIRLCWRMLSAADTRCRQHPVSSAVWLARRKDGQSRAKSLLPKPNALLVGVKADKLLIGKFSHKRNGSAMWLINALWWIMVICLCFVCLVNFDWMNKTNDTNNLVHILLFDLTFNSQCPANILTFILIFTHFDIQQNLYLFVPGDILLATAFLSYSGPFNQEFRNLLLSDWQRELKQRHIPFGSNLNLTELLIDAPTVSEWNLQVSDLFWQRLPTESTILMQERSKCCLCVL